MADVHLLGNILVRHLGANEFQEFFFLGSERHYFFLYVYIFMQATSIFSEMKSDK